MLQRTSASFQVDAFTVLPATLPAPLVAPVADKAAHQLGTLSHPGASSSASPATKQPVLPETGSSMAEGNVLLTPTPALVSSDVLIEEIAPAALAAPEVTKVCSSQNVRYHITFIHPFVVFIPVRMSTINFYVSHCRKPVAMSPDANQHTPESRPCTACYSPWT